MDYIKFYNEAKKYLLDNDLVNLEDIKKHIKPETKRKNLIA